jgi:hypothetical protein
VREERLVPPVIGAAVNTSVPREAQRRKARLLIQQSAFFEGQTSEARRNERPLRESGARRCLNEVRTVIQVRIQTLKAQSKFPIQHLRKVLEDGNLSISPRYSYLVFCSLTKG